MATYVRRRVLRNVSWEAEDNSQRENRRDTLCEFDGLLAHLEEINLRGGTIPPFVIGRLEQCGITYSPGTTTAELIEAVFNVQERYMRQPIEVPGRRTRKKKPAPADDALLFLTGTSDRKSNRNLPFSI